MLSIHCNKMKTLKFKIFINTLNTLFITSFVLMYIYLLLYFFLGGGTGFVGQYLKQYLKANNYDVTIITRNTNYLNKCGSMISWV